MKMELGLNYNINIKMAIRLTDTITTSEGSLTNVYFHITQYFRDKDGVNSVFKVQYFTDDTKATECLVFHDELKAQFFVDISSGNVGTDKIEKLAYDKLGADLKAAGLNPESDETGSWVAY